MASAPIYIPSSSLTPLPSQPSISDVLSSQASISPRSPTYREHRLLPFELQEHCLIYLEETLYTQALNLLLSVLSSGATPPSQLPAIVAPPHFLSLIATLSIHPTLTNRAKTSDRTHAGNLALRYLRATLYTVGPFGASLAEAFRYRPENGGPARNGRKTRRRTRDIEVKNDDFEDIDNDLANASSLWIRADGFWHAVGWAFNCSVLHHNRWEAWRGWLELMVDVLEMEWHGRLAKSEDLEQSMIAQYCGGNNKIGGSEKRILRAIFADGSARAANEFGEVWIKETKDLKKQDDSKKAEKIDIDANDYGDYLDEENDADFESASSSTASNSDTRPKGGSKRKRVETANGATHLGGVEALSLRLRLLSLLSELSAHLPESFLTTTNLYELVQEYIRPLPLPTFFLIMSPSGLRQFTVEGASSFTQYVLLTMLDANAPQPPNDQLNQAILEECYLPWPANTTAVAENTKVGLCVETLLRLLDGEHALSGTDRLLQAAQKGIKARRDKCSGTTNRRRKRSSGVTGDCSLLDGSAQRIEAVVKMAQARVEQETSS